MAGVVRTLFFLFVRDTTSLWMLYAFVILYGLGQGSTLSISAATVGDLFSGSSVRRIVGIVAIAFGLGGALGAYVGGYFYDQMGSYTFPFLLVLTSISVANIAIWTAAPRRR